MLHPRPNNIEELREITRARIKDIGFGDPITNICAGENNPSRTGVFVDYSSYSKTVNMAYGTGRRRKFYDVSADVIYPGHLGYGLCKSLFRPIWEIKFGRNGGGLCSDCPAPGYPTDKTRCNDCPRKTQAA